LSCETGLIPRCRSYSEKEKATSSHGEWLAWEDPNHVLTWQYYGLWQIEQGNRYQAHENAERPGIAVGPFFFF
jgi:hypothetical protein